MSDSDPSQPSNPSNSPFNPPRVIAERCVYLVWIIYFTVALGTLLLACIEGIFCLVTLTLPTTFLGIIALNFPISLYLRGKGIRHLRFLEHEDSLNHLGQNYVESFKSRNQVLHEIIKRYQLIEKASVWDRIELRQETKRWLLSLPPQDVLRDRQQIEDLFGYLLPSDWLEHKND